MLDDLLEIESLPAAGVILRTSQSLEKDTVPAPSACCLAARKESTSTGKGQTPKRIQKVLPSSRWSRFSCSTKQ